MTVIQRRWVLLFGLMAFFIVVDQITKELVIQNIARYDAVIPIPFLSDFFEITHSYNTGAAFGIFPQAGGVFTVLAVLIVGGLLFYFPRIPDAGWPTRLGVAMISGGALGNVIDRLRHGHVTDFIHYQIPDLISNVSNLADHAIVLGVFIIVFDSFRLERIEKREAEAIRMANDDTEDSTSAYNETEQANPTDTRS